MGQRLLLAVHAADQSILLVAWWRRGAHIYSGGGLSDRKPSLHVLLVGFQQLLASRTFQSGVKLLLSTGAVLLATILLMAYIPAVAHSVPIFGYAAVVLCFQPRVEATVDQASCSWPTTLTAGTRAQLTHYVFPCPHQVLSNVLCCAVLAMQTAASASLHHSSGCPCSQGFTAHNTAAAAAALPGCSACVWHNPWCMPRPGNQQRTTHLP